MSRFSFICLCFLIHWIAKAQVLQSNQDFSYTALALETNARQDAILINNKDYIVFSKVKGSYLTPTSDYLLEKYDLSMQKLFSIPITLSADEDFKFLKNYKDQVYLFIEVHAITTKHSELKVLKYNLADGSFIESKLLMEATIQDWMTVSGKGASKESFENAISSAVSKNFNTPIEYQYQVEFSPDGKSFITYRYDYSQRTLSAPFAIYNMDLSSGLSGVTPIDNYFINQGLYINNKQEIFIFNTERSGRIALIKYDPINKDNIFLDIQSGTSKRESFSLQFLNDDAIYIAALITMGKKATGVLYAKFNFKDVLIEKLNIQEISDGLKQTAATLRQNNKISGQEDWMNYHITDFQVNQYEKIIFVLEKRYLEYTEIQYDPNAVNDVKNWGEKIGKVKVESIVALSVNNEDKILWENYILKNQVMDITAGVNTSSYKFHITVDGKVRFLYAYSNLSTGVMSNVRFLEWNELTGFKIRDTDLPSEESLTMLRNYSVWSDTELILVAKKGLLGKKSSCYVYSIQNKI
ncbi:MAG: hypothetical protein U0U66_00920 [Cytophagaceae bacterium]